MKISHLKYAVKLASCKTFLSAAEQLFITQPTLSQQIKILENEIGTPIFIRDRKEIRLTPAGIEFIEYAKNILNQISTLDEVMTKYRSPMQGTLKIGLLWTFGYLKLDHYIQSFQKEYPLIEVTLVIEGSDALKKKLIEHELDLLFINGKPSDFEYSNLEYYKVSESNICVLMNESHHLASRPQITAEDLAGESLLMTSQATNIYHDIKAAIDCSGIAPKIIGNSGQIDVCVQVAASGLGVSFASKQMADWYEHFPIKAIPFYPQISRTTYMVYNRKNQQRNTVPTFVAFMQSLMQ